MSDNSKILVELGLAADQFESSLARARESFGGSVSGMGDDAREAGADIDRAFGALGIKSVESIRYEIATLRQAFDALKTSGRASAEDIARAESALQTKVAALNNEIARGRTVAQTAGKALQDAFGVVGVRSSEAINAEIREINAGLRKIALDSKVTGSEFDRAFASAQKRIAALEAELSGVAKQTANAARATDSYSTSVSGAMRSVAAWVSAAIGLNSVIGMASRVLETGSAFEVLGARLTQMLGSSYQAKQALQGIKDLAASTPFEVKDLSEAFVRLTAFGMQPSRDMMVSLTDTAASLGGGTEALQRVTIALGQAWVKGKLQGEEIMQLTEAGVPVWDALAKATGKNTTELAEMSKSGQLGRDVISKLIATLGQMNMGASAAQMNTFSGSVSNAKDAMTEFMAKIADSGVMEYAKSQIQALLAEFERMKNSGELQQKAKAIADGFIGMASAVKSVVTTVKEYSGAIKLALEVLVVGKIVSFTGALVSQAKASITAATSARLMNSALGATGPAAASASVSSAVAAAGISAVTIGARAATAALIAMRLAFRAIGLGLLVEALSFLIGKLFPLKAATDDAAVSTSRFAVETQHAEESVRANADAHDLLANKINRTSYQSERLTSQMANARSASAELGISLEQFGRVTSESFNKALDSLSTLIRSFPVLKAQGIDTAAVLDAALQKMIAAAKNSKEVEVLTARIKALGKAGELTGQQVADGLEAARKKTVDLTREAGSAEEALKKMGIKSHEELVRTAEEYKKLYQQVRDSGTAAPEDVQKAFEKYAEAAIAANDRVVSSELKVQAGMRGIGTETDATTGKVIRLKNAMDGVKTPGGGSGGSGGSGGGDRGPSPGSGSADHPSNELGSGSSLIKNDWGIADQPDRSSNVGVYGDLGTDPRQVALRLGLKGKQIEAFVEYYNANIDAENAAAYSGGINQAAHSTGYDPGVGAFKRIKRQAEEYARRQSPSTMPSSGSGGSGGGVSMPVSNQTRNVTINIGNIHNQSDVDALIEQLRTAAGVAS